MQQRKNILFLASWFPNKTDESSGIYVKKHAFAVNEAHNVFVIHVCSDAQLKEKFQVSFSEENGLKIINAYYRKLGNVVPFFSKALKFKRYKQAFRLAIKKMEQTGFKPDLVHLHVIMPMAVAAVEYCKKQKLPLVITEHWSGFMAEDELYNGAVTKFFTSEAVRMSKAITVVSEGLKGSMLRHDLNGNYTVVPNIVEGSKTILTSKPVQPFKVGMVAAMYDRQKNISGAIDAVKLLLKENSNVELHIAGTGHDEKRLKERAGDLLDRKIFFKGYLSGEKVFAFYNSVNCILVPSNFETFSVVAAEALSSGVPVITAKCGGPEGFVNKECGLILESKSPEGIAKGITEMTKYYSSFDPEKISNYARTLFDKGSIIKKFDEVYRSVLK
jgi:glycosyltransferase involved in cell wall biosynthesis